MFNGRFLALVSLGLGLVVACTAGAAPSSDDRQARGRKGSTMKNHDKPSDDELRRRLTPLQYHVTQEEGTEPAFDNAYWNHKAPGIYVDVVSGEALFSSQDKFDSGTGWPSFTRPLDPEHVVRRVDRTLWMKRIEARSRKGDSHLGHVFDDGPAPTGERWCINSAALRFVPAHRLTAEGYGVHAKRFPDVKQDPPPAAARAEREVAILAGGCFWGMEDLLRKIPGVIDTEVGYTGGSLASPRYTDVSTGRTGHAEAVQITFDPRVLSYEALLGWFFRMHDPTTRNRQGNDVGTQYRSAIFVNSDAQRRVAEEVKARVDKSGKWKRPIVTEVVEAGPFHRAEDYHQDYLEKQPDGYTCHYLRD